jgi:hypothetical protein
MDVMLIESRPGVGEGVATALTEAGDRVHRCQTAEHRDAAFPCRGIEHPEECPLSRGAQVAVLVRHRISHPPTPNEHGVYCALRAGLPVVEEGPEVIDPFEPWLTSRSDGDIVGSCRAALEIAVAPWRDSVVETTSPIVAEAGIDPTLVDWSIEVGADRLHLVARGPALDRSARSRVAVRALGVVRGSPFARECMDVDYRNIDD